MIQQRRIGEILVAEGIISQEKLNEMLEKQKQSDKRLGDFLVEQQVITEEQKLTALSRRFNIKIEDLGTADISKEATKLITEEIARKYEIMPISVDEEKLVIATDDPLNFYAFEEISAMVGGRSVKVVLSSKQVILDTIERVYGEQLSQRAVDEMNVEMLDEEIPKDVGDEELKRIMEKIDNAPIVKLVTTLVTQAHNMRASDVHIEPDEDECRVRMRVDGDLVKVMTITPAIYTALVARIKIMSDMDIAEKRVPQDGRLTTRIPSGLDVNIRVNSLPTVHGEKLVMRLLADDAGILKITELGMTEHNYNMFTKILKSPHGIILVTGPTGSGKTTTLYAAIGEIAKPTVNVITIEDPVEKNIPGINQVHVNNKAGMDFAAGLRAILRQDPDVIMIGEIRDYETASIAARAAITGHLVFATMHTNDAVSTFDRMIDMGVEPFMVATALRGVIAQRLVRYICPNCRVAYHPCDTEISFLGENEAQVLYKGKGCTKCNFTGYMGRTSIHEVVSVSANMRDMISKRAPASEIKKYCQENGATFLRDNIVDLVLDGRTTMDELIRLTYTVE